MSAATSAVRLLLVDDHALFREGIARLLAAEPEFEVRGRAGSIKEAQAALGAAPFDVVILDVDLGQERGLDLMPELRRSHPGVKVLLVTAGVSDREAIQYIQAGAAGIFHKTRPPEELCEAVRSVARGEVFLEPEYMRPLFSAADPSHDVRPKLTEREVAITRLILEGLANKEIGERLGLAESTVKAALRQLFDRVGVRTRSQLVKVALEQYRDLL